MVEMRLGNLFSAYRPKGNIMKIGDYANAFLWCFAMAAIVVPVALSKGFGWYSAGQAASTVRQAEQAAVVKALTPFCIASFQKAEDAPAKLAPLKKIGSARRS